MSSDVRVLSLRLYGVLEKVGASEEIRQLTREVAVRNEIYETINSRQYMEDAQTLNCGSRYEGTFTRGTLSDMDTIYTGGLTASLKLHADSWTLVINDEEIFPGYVRLQLVENGHPMTVYDGRSLERNIPVDIDNKGRLCLKHIDIVDRQGPARQVKDATGRHIFDRVIAIRCNGIPNFAEEWMTRKRMYGWPTGEQISEMEAMGCMLVLVGHGVSGKSDIEYRLSFSLQERFLMASLNPVQHKVYILLKIINADLVRPAMKGKVLTSYHLKTCVLNMAENTPNSIWKDDNLIPCVLLCLKTLCLWIRNKYCPSYFMKYQNLFHTSEFSRYRNKLLYEMRHLYHMGAKLFLLIKKEDIGAMLTEDGYKALSSIKDKIRATLMLEVLSLNVTFPWFAVGSRQSVTSMHTFIEELESTKTITYHSEEETKLAINVVLPWLKLYLAKTLICGALKMQLQQSPDGILAMNVANYYLKSAFPTDLVQTNFVKASYLFRVRQYEECYTLLCHIEDDIANDSITVCICSGALLLRSSTKEWEDKFATLSPTEMSQRIAQCVYFLPTQREITPEPLQLEMDRSKGMPSGSRNEILQHWFDLAVVDAVVYLYFLKYRICSELGMRERKISAWSKLVYVTQSTLGHKETAYNLLGWICKKENLVGYAIRYFMESWSIRPFHNAAKFHMNDMNETLRKIIRAWIPGPRVMFGLPIYSKPLLMRPPKLGLILTYRGK